MGRCACTKHVQTGENDQENAEEEEEAEEGRSSGQCKSLVPDTLRLFLFSTLFYTEDVTRDMPA